MTPRQRIVWLDLEDAAEESWRLVVEHRFTRYLLCAGDPGGAGAGSPPVVRRDDGSLLVDASLSIEEFREALGLGERRDGPREFRTAGGLVFSALGRVPRPGEHFVLEGWRVEVVDMDGNRIDKLLASRREGIPER